MWKQEDKAAHEEEKDNNGGVTSPKEAQSRSRKRDSRHILK